MHAASYQRNTTWPNCVKPLLTPPLFFNNGSTGSQNHGHCTHPSPPLMDVGTVLQILQPVRIPALYRSLSCSFLPLMHSTAFRQESCKCAKTAKKQALSRVKMSWNKSEWRGLARDRYSWKMRRTCETQNCQENVKPRQIR